MKRTPPTQKKLEETEMDLLRKRRGLNPNDDVNDKVGFGLSGGGIRSATFCLGVFQALAKLNLLSKIDYLSSVSGGGYFGAFYRLLFTRKEITSISNVRKLLFRAPTARRKRWRPRASFR